MFLIIHIYNDNKIVSVSVIIVIEAPKKKKKKLNCSETAALK